MALVRGLDPAELTNAHAVAARDYILAVLLGEAREPKTKEEDRCDIGDCKRAGKGGRWIQCNTCGRWMHYKCAGIRRAPKVFTCCYCNAQYE